MGRKKKTADIINIDELKIENKVEIDYDKLAQAIIKSKTEIENKERKQRQEKEDDMQNKRKEILGEKDFSHIKNKTLREFRVFLNDLRVAWKMLTMSKEEAMYFTTVSSLTKMLTSFLLFLIELAIFAFAGVVLYFSVSSGLVFSDGIIVALFSVAFARMIRIARFEIERIDDNNYLMNISMMVIAVVTLVITILGLFISSSNSGG